ncbi:MBL fold metallo-hydrolase [Brooklawnia cerclae]|uniref:Glyoxylase-like metal-dependent hydrolase (Beta-lactamase superfamily II) n=1 Tax=Brooklawnia cerclae TaxID=349934 RepID=A0ABX0SGH8_9ACTN|nr:glyoxylase-like metal-dependent hydrolase (beta-lactamase superfamily II) [Brooklawnia cerclae]
MTDPYHTGPREEPIVFTVGAVTCTKVSVGPMDNNAYLLTPSEGPLVLIDAAAEAATLLDLIGTRPLGTVVTTHRHTDHLGALARVVRDTGAAPVAGRPDVDAITEQTGIRSRGVWTGDTIPVGTTSLEVIGLAGHTPGGIALALRPDDGPTHLFTGDSLFPGGVGKTLTPRDFSALLGNVAALVFEPFGDETLVHPGHGDSTTLGAERPHLDEWRARGW